jgi:hypothetical protein
MANHTCNKNCGCKDSYTVTAPCPPACPEVFNSQCIVYTGTDIICNTTTVISRYDYLDTVITKLVNYICNTVGPITTVVGSTYIDVVPATVANVTTYNVSVDIPALQAYFDTVFQNDLFASILAGPGIAVATNAITGTVTISHQDTSAVNNLNSDNSGNTFIQDIAFAFDTFGHVTGASVVAVSVTPPNDFDRAQINPDSGFVWGPANDPTNIQIAEAPGDTLNFVAGTGIVLNASTVPSTDAIRITNSAPDQTVVLNEGAGIDITGTYPNFTVINTDLGSAVTLASVGLGQSLVNDGFGPALVTKSIINGTGILVTGNTTEVQITNTAPNVDQNLWATISATIGSTTANTTTDILTVAGANGISTSIAADTLTITSPINRDSSSVTAQVIALATLYNLTHTLGQQFVSLTIINTATQGDVTGRFDIIYSGSGTYSIEENDGFTGTVRVLAIG